MGNYFLDIWYNVRSCKTLICGRIMEWYVRKPERPADQQNRGRLGDHGTPVPVDGGHSQASIFVYSLVLKLFQDTYISFLC